jgi:hypothetical protein
MQELIAIAPVALGLVPVLVAVKMLQGRLDNPPPVYVDSPPPRVYAAIKKAIAGFYLGEYHFRIVTTDPNELSIRAVMEYRERLRPELQHFSPKGYRFHQVILDVVVGLDKETRKSKVRFVWTVHALLFRGKVWLVKPALESVISQALRKVEQPKREKVS